MLIKVKLQGSVTAKALVVDSLEALKEKGLKAELICWISFHFSRLFDFFPFEIAPYSWFEVLIDIYFFLNHFNRRKQIFNKKIRFVACV